MSVPDIAYQCRTSHSRAVGRQENSPRRNQVRKSAFAVQTVAGIGLLGVDLTLKVSSVACSDHPSHPPTTPFSDRAIRYLSTGHRIGIA
eukprot:1733843-Rhodomonas_salina.6